LHQAIVALAMAPSSVFVVPIFIWILVTFRRGDLDRWISGRTGKRHVHDRSNKKAAKRGLDRVDAE